MAQSYNEIFQGFSGSLNRQLLVKQFYGRTLFCNFPDRSKVIYSTKQKEEQQRFKNAVSFARVVISHQVLKNSYSLKARQFNFRSAWHAAIAHFMCKTELKVKPQKVRFNKKLITSGLGKSIHINLYKILRPVDTECRQQIVTDGPAPPRDNSVTSALFTSRELACPVSGITRCIV